MIIRGVDLPHALPGHWATASGWSMAMTYAEKDRADLAMGARSDLMLANDVFLVGRYDLDLIQFQEAAKQRIRWLSVQLAMAEAALKVDA